MYIISKTIKGKEFIYSTKYSILCKSKKQAEELATFLNNHDESATGGFKLKENETWHVYQIDKYSTPPEYRISNTKGKISIKKLDKIKWLESQNIYL